MDVNERQRELDSAEFIFGLKRTHSRQARNRNNKLRFTTESFFPKKLWVQRLNLKRVTNNLIANAIKHTQNGFIDVSIRLESIKLDHFNCQYNLVGAQPIDGNDYITFEVKDTGEGINKDMLSTIFLSESLTESENKLNTDIDNSEVSGLGLPICK